MRTKTLAEAQADRVEGVAELLDRCTGLGCNMPDTSTVQVHFQVLAPRILGNPNDFVLGEDSAVQSVLESDDLRWRVMNVTVEDNT